MNRFAFLVLGTAMLFGCSDDNNNAVDGPVSSDAKTADASTSGGDAAANGDGGGGTSFTVTLSNANEPSGTCSVGAPGTGATGTATVAVSADNSTITVDLTFSNLSGAVGAGHIHFGTPTDAGPVVISLLSQGATSPFHGTFTAAQYINGGTGNPTAPATFADFVTQLKMGGKAYVNVHTGNCPNGEIRAELQ